MPEPSIELVALLSYCVHLAAMWSCIDKRCFERHSYFSCAWGLRKTHPIRGWVSGIGLTLAFTGLVAHATGRLLF